MGKALTTEQFVDKAIKVHGTKYSYNKTNYIGTSIKIEIICSEHGSFWQLPKDHINGRGCRKCGFIKCTACAIKTTEQVIKQFKEIHGYKYTYNKVNYIKDNVKVLITCPIHGDWEQIPSSHLQGCGCPECGIIEAANKRIYSFEYFIEQAHIVHDKKYTYDKLSYKSYRKHTKIICNMCKMVFNTSPQHHVNGTGCPSCAKSGFDSAKSAILYYLKIGTKDNQTLYKIGVTNRTVNERFNLADLSKIEILKQEEFMVGKDALDKEASIKLKFKEFKYKGPNVLSSGNTELFIKDIFNIL